MQLKIVEKGEYVKAHGPLTTRGIRSDSRDRLWEEFTKLQPGQVMTVKLEGQKKLESLRRQIINCLAPVLKETGWGISTSLNQKEKFVVVEKFEKRRLRKDDFLKQIQATTKLGRQAPLQRPM